MINKHINIDLIPLPADILLGLLYMRGSNTPTRALAIINSINDSGPSEILLLSNQYKTSLIFSKAVVSFIKILNDDYVENRFFIFGTRPKKILFNSIPAMSEDPFMDNKYVALWGPELSPSIKKNSWPIDLLDKSHKEVIGEFQAVDIIKEQGMDDMLLRLRREGRRT